MVPSDVPEALIALGIICCIVWAIYNWRHHDAKARR
jgi:hypothetical protein